MDWFDVLVPGVISGIAATLVLLGLQRLVRPLWQRYESWRSARNNLLWRKAAKDLESVDKSLLVGREVVRVGVYLFMTILATADVREDVGDVQATATIGLVTALTLAILRSSTRMNYYVALARRG